MSANKSMSRSRWLCSQPALCCAWRRFRSGTRVERRSRGPLHHFLILLGAKTAACSPSSFQLVHSTAGFVEQQRLWMDGWTAKEGRLFPSFLPSCLLLRCASSPPSLHPHLPMFPRHFISGWEIHQCFHCTKLWRRWEKCIAESSSTQNEDRPSSAEEAFPPRPFWPSRSPNNC